MEKDRGWMGGVMDAKEMKVAGKSELVLAYRLGLFDPDPDIQEIRWVSKKLKSTPQNVIDMKAAVRQFNQLAARDRESHLCLGIFAVSR